MKNEDDTQLDSPSITYSITVGDNLHERFERHVAILKRVKPGKFKKHDWLLEAFEEYMREVEAKTDNQIPKDKRLSFRLNPHFVKELEKCISKQKQYRSSYSKKQWFVEAIHRKLSEEEDLIKKYQKEIENPIE